MEDTFKIGLIVKPHGVRGELKVMPLTDDSARFKRLKSVIIDGKNYGVSGTKIAADAVYLSLSEICDRNTAELFRGKFLRVKREDAAPLEENSYYIADIIGCRVITETGKEICTVKDVISAKTDVFSGETADGKTVRFPFLKDALIGVDIAARTITVKEKRFGEISLYEN